MMRYAMFGLLILHVGAAPIDMHSQMIDNHVDHAIQPTGLDGSKMKAFEAGSMVAPAAAPTATPIVGNAVTLTQKGSKAKDEDEAGHFDKNAVLAQDSKAKTTAVNAACECVQCPKGIYCGDQYGNNYDQCVTAGWVYSGHNEGPQCKWSQPKPMGCICKAFPAHAGGNIANGLTFEGGCQQVPGYGSVLCHSVHPGTTTPCDCQSIKSYDECVTDHGWCEWAGDPFNTFTGKWEFINTGAHEKFKVTSSYSTSNSDYTSTTFGVSLSQTDTISYSAGDAGGEGASATESATESWSHTASNTITKIEGGSTSVECEPQTCENGYLYQWQLTGQGANQLLATLSSCNFVCVVSNLDSVAGHPKCPLGYCDKNMECQCCTGEWTTDGQYQKYLSNTHTGGSCFFPSHTKHLIPKEG